MTDSATFLERFSILTPLGLRFRDAVTNAVVDEGLSVTAYSPHNPSRVTNAFTNRQGVFAFRGLPGLRGVENSAGDKAFWDNVAVDSRPFVIQVQDDLRRYHPFQLKIIVPVKQLYRWELAEIGSPPPNEVPVPLYSTAFRRPPAGMAVVRAQLLDLFSGQPAAWAQLDAIVDGNVVGRGVSGIDGQLMITFPFPEPKNPLTSSPVSPSTYGSLTPLLDQVWSLSLRAYYDPIKPVPEIPALVSVFSQAPATLWSSQSPLTELGEQQLENGKELIVSSDAEHVLLISRMSSPS